MVYRFARCWAVCGWAGLVVGPALGAGPPQAKAVASATDLTLAGQVLDETGGALPGARVMLRQLATGFERLTHADEHGRFAFAGLPPGPHLVEAHAEGFAPQRAEREPGTPAGVDLQLRLHPAPVVEQVTVVSQARQDEVRAALHTRVDVLSAARARDTGYESVGELLSELPGVVVRRGSEGSAPAGQQIQGLDSRQVLVLIDGQPLVAARGIKRGVVDLDRQSLARLERVEVVKGAASALYGSDAVGGVINLVTREPRAPWEGGLALSAAARGALDARGRAGFVAGRTQGLVSLEHHERDGFDLTPSTPDSTAARTRRWDGSAKWRHDLGHDLALRAYAHGYRHRARGVTLGELGYQADDVEESTANLGLALEAHIGARTQGQLRVHHARYAERARARLLEAPQAALEPGELSERLLKVDAGLARVLGDRHWLQAGVEVWHDAYRGENRLRDASGESMRTAVGWVQDRLSLGRVVLTLGTRYDDNSVFGAAWSPKLGFNLRLAPAASLRASVGRGFRAPDLGQLYYRFLNPSAFYQVLGNPRLRPERSNSYQWGAELGTPGGRARLGFNFYRNDVRDLIESTSLGFVATPAQLAALLQREQLDPGFRPALGRLLFTYRNLRHVRTQGLEADAELALARGTALAAAYALLDAHDAATGLVLTQRSRHSLHGRLAWQTPGGGTRANLRAHYLSSFVVTRSGQGAQAVEARAPGYWTFDLHMARALGRRLEAYAALDNLADSRDPNAGRLDAGGQPLPIFRPEAGRSLRVGLRFEVHP